MVKCRTPNRNFCTPDGKNAALFVDLDGTMVVCQPYFDEAAACFSHFMKLRGFDGEEAMQTARQFNQHFMETHGFERDVFPSALVAAYNSMVEKHKRRVKPDEKSMDELIVHSIGTRPFFRQPEVFPNAAEVLGRARHSFLIFAVSMGNREAQKHKIRKAGLDPVFDEAIITSRDDKAEIVSQVMHDWQISPRYSAFVGNSRRSDGAALAVTNFIYLPIEPGTAFDAARPLPQSEFEMFTVKDWREGEEKAINRLLRRRKSAEPADPDDTDTGSGGSAKSLKKGCCK